MSRCPRCSKDIYPLAAHHRLKDCEPTTYALALEEDIAKERAENKQLRRELAEEKQRVNDLFQIKANEKLSS